MVLYLVTLTDLETRHAGLSASAELLVLLMRQAGSGALDRLRARVKALKRKADI